MDTTCYYTFGMYFNKAEKRAPNRISIYDVIKLPFSTLILSCNKTSHIITAASLIDQKRRSNDTTGFTDATIPVLHRGRLYCVDDQ